MGRKDVDVAEEMLGIVTAEGIQVLLDARRVSVHGLSGDQITDTVRMAADEQKVEGSDLPVAVGRIANTGAIALDKAGEALDARGYVQINERLATTAPRVWAIGECAGSLQFTHVSVDDFRIVRDVWPAAIAEPMIGWLQCLSRGRANQVHH
jgi:pyruvate/2-oxoglutarate dehydrogenase complex dihydrolipoamide dehydrogenase (E3) component